MELRYEGKGAGDAVNFKVGLVDFIWEEGASAKRICLSVLLFLINGRGSNKNKARKRYMF